MELEKITAHNYLRLHLDPTGGQQRPDVSGADYEPFSVRVVLRAYHPVGG